MNTKIIGFDESGKIGDNQIYFSQIELNEENEPEIFIDNILNSKDFFYNERELRGWDYQKKGKICHNLVAKNLIKIKLYKLNSIEQNKILSDVFRYQASFLYKERDLMIEIFKKVKPVDSLSHIISQLSHYRDSSYFPDFCLKSYAYLYILDRYCKKQTTCNFLKEEDNLIKAQIDGGNIFSFWWFDLLNNHVNKEIVGKNMIINGISHGDQYYLSMNLAHLFSQVFRKSPHNFINYKIEDISYDFADIKFSEPIFYEKIWRYLKNFYFKNRLIFIGKSELFNIIPYLLHFKKRGVIYEPFRIQKKVSDYFNYFKIGPPEKNLVIYSQKLKKEDKLSIDYCKELGIITKPVSEFKEQYTDFSNYISETTEYYNSDVKRKVVDVLKKYKNYF